MQLLNLIIIITYFVGIICNDIGFGYVLLLTIATMLNLIGFKNKSINGHYALYIYWFVYWASCIFMPAFDLISPNLTKYYVTITPEWNNKIFEFGIIVYFIMCLFFAFQSAKIDNNKYKFFQSNISLKLIKIVLIASIVLTCFCLVTGLGRLGADRIVLPFKLSGVIVYFRQYFIPGFFCVFVENFTRRNLKIPKQIWVLYIFWCLLEIPAWMSKSIFVTHLIPVLLFLFFYYRPKIKVIIKTVAPILVIFLFLYPIIAIARYSINSESFELSQIKEAYKEVQSDDSNNNPFLKPLNRTFGFGMRYAQDYYYINHDDLFDFSLSPILFEFGGAAKFQTFFIDGFPENANHSSGTDGIIDPLLHGGIGLLVIIIILNFFLAQWIDRLINHGYYSIAAILIFPFFIWIGTVNISSLYDSVGPQSYFMNMICIYIAYKLNYSKKVKL